MNKFLIILLIVFWGCETPIIHVDNPIETPTVKNLKPIMLDAFHIELSWELDDTLFNIHFNNSSNNLDVIDNFIIYVSNGGMFKPYDTINTYINNIDTILTHRLLFLENQFYNKDLRFYIDAYSNGLNQKSISSDTSQTIKFYYPSPQIESDINSTNFFLNILDTLCDKMVNNSGSVININRIIHFDSKDTQSVLIDTIYSSLENIHYYDSLSLNPDISTEILPGINLPAYNTIPPETKIDYLININQRMQGINRSSDTITFTNNYASNNFNFNVRAISKKSMRIYIDEMNWIPDFDTIFVYIKNQNNIEWYLDSNNKFVVNNEYSDSGIQLNQYTANYHLNISNLMDGDSVFIVQKGLNSYLYDKKNIKEVDLLSIDGFTLVDSGTMCAGLDSNCEFDNVIQIEEFYMAIYELTNNNSVQEYLEYIDIGHPKELTYYQSMDFISILNEYDFEQDYNYEFNIPTGNEWEYAAKMNYNSNNDSSYRRYPWGESITNYNANYINSDDTLGIKDVGSYSDYPSDFGINDMAGNLVEWVRDEYSEDPNIHYARGGGYWHGPEEVKTISAIVVNDEVYQGMGLRILMRRQ